MEERILEESKEEEFDHYNAPMCWQSFITVLVFGILGGAFFNTFFDTFETEWLKVVMVVSYTLLISAIGMKITRQVREKD